MARVKKSTAPAAGDGDGRAISDDDDLFGSDGEGSAATSQAEAAVRAAERWLRTRRRDVLSDMFDGASLGELDALVEERGMAEATAVLLTVLEPLDQATAALDATLAEATAALAALDGSGSSNAAPPDACHVDPVPAPPARTRLRCTRSVARPG